MKNRTCKKCGLIQMYDEIYGLVFCDANEAFFYGCPEREELLKRFPDLKYDESKIIEQPLTRHFLNPLKETGQKNE